MRQQDQLKAMTEDFKQSYGFELPWQIPDYAPIKNGGWSVRLRPRGVAASYLAHEVIEPPHAVLYHGNEVWMSTGLLELESHAWHLNCANGNLLVAGLGMGMYLHAASMKTEVRRIVVIERDPDVIRLMKESTGFENWVHRDKITIIEGDALAAEMQEKVGIAFEGDRPDYLYADIWPVFPHPEAPAQTKAMADLYNPRTGGWWGQEVEFGVWLEDHARDASLDSLHEFFEYHGINARIDDGYLEFCRDTITVQLSEGFENSLGATPASFAPGGW